jgi:GDSL-like Lipase/Acylhydrolase family
MVGAELGGPGRRVRRRDRSVRWLLASTFFVGAVLGAGAQELLAATVGNGSPSGGGEASTAASAVDRPGRVVLLGDSLTIQAGVHGPHAAEPRYLQTAAGVGWTATDARTGLDDAAETAPIDTLVIALGTNDSSLSDGADGWSEADLSAFRRLLSTPSPEACVVLVLPGHGPQIDPAYGAEMDEARSALDFLAHERRQQAGTGPTVVVDWQAALDAQPGVMADDGIHLSGDAGSEPGSASAQSAATRLDLYWDGVAQCQADGDPADGAGFADHLD